MINQLLESLATFVIFLIQTTSYLGIALLMALESCNIPIPSEVTLPFAGFLTSQGILKGSVVVLFAVIGSLIGTSLSFAIGKFLYPWIVLFSSGAGKILVSIEELNVIRSWFTKHGYWVVLFGAMMPVVRTYLGLASGAAGMSYKKFIMSYAIGDIIWSSILTYLGYTLGIHWDQLGPVFRKFDYLIIFLGIILLAWLVWHRVKRFRE